MTEARPPFWIERGRSREGHRVHVSTESPEKKEPLHEYVARVGGSPVLSDIPRYSQPGTTTARVSAAKIPAVNAALFVLTFLTTTMAGAYMAGADLSILRPFSSGLQLYAGLTFSIPLMAILLAHEMGHYLTARRNRVDVSPPYFIPAPFPSLFIIGTFGAFIRMRSMPRSRRVLFDIGAAGPWAGVIVTIPILIIGLFLSKVGPLNKSVGRFRTRQLASFSSTREVDSARRSRHRQRGPSCDGIRGMARALCHRA